MPWTNDPSGIGLSAVPASGGTGWQIWSSTEPMAGGDYSTSVPYYNNSLNIYPFLSSSDTTCFKMYSPGSSDITATRELILPLSIGNGVDTGVLAINVGVNSRNGEKGVLFYRNNTLIAGFKAGLDDSLTQQYMGFSNNVWSNIDDILHQPIPHQPDSVFCLKIWRTNAPGVGNYNIFYIYRLNYEGYDEIPTPISSGGKQVYEATMFNGANSAITKLTLYTRDVDSNPVLENENSLYFNFLSGHSAYR